MSTKLLTTGDFFCEIALLDAGPRTTATAHTELVAEVISHRGLGNLLMGAPDVSRAILKGVAARPRAAGATFVH
jgi:CRP-like cAMP-binding protein